MRTSPLAWLAALLLSAAPATAGAPPKDPLIQAATEGKAYLLAEFVSQTCPTCEEMRPVVHGVLGRYPRLLHQV
ncbi:MAG: hypothetical protein ACYDA8_18525, partial [Deferrisomatales bacterium]